MPQVRLLLCLSLIIVSSVSSLSHLLPSLETNTFLICYIFCFEIIGGELFDHILAHRYLKERDACRLFAQLMSGVHYLHSKHIVHRDLKLVRTAMQRNLQTAYVIYIYIYLFICVWWLTLAFLFFLGKLAVGQESQYHNHRLWIRKPV